VWFIAVKVNQIKFGANTFPLLSYYYYFGPLAVLLCCYVISFAVAVAARYASPMLIPQDNAATFAAG